MDDNDSSDTLKPTLEQLQAASVAWKTIDTSPVMGSDTSGFPTSSGNEDRVVLTPTTLKHPLVGSLSVQ